MSPRTHLRLSARTPWTHHYSLHKSYKRVHARSTLPLLPALTHKCTDSTASGASTYTRVRTTSRRSAHCGGVITNYYRELSAARRRESWRPRPVATGKHRGGTVGAVRPVGKVSVY